MGHYLYIADRFNFFAFLFSLFGCITHCIGWLNRFYWTPVQQHELVAEMLGFCLGTIFLFVFTECVMLEHSGRWCKLYLWGNRSALFIFNDAESIKQAAESLALASHLFQVSLKELQSGKIPVASARPREFMRRTVLSFLLFESVVLPIEYRQAVLSRTNDGMFVIASSFMHTPGRAFFLFVLCSSLLCFLFCLSRIVARPSLRWAFLLGDKGRTVLCYKDQTTP